MALALCIQQGAHAQPKPNFGKPPKVKSGGKTARTYKTPKLGGSDDWKANRLEYLLGAGASGFLGDLGGQDNVGKPFIYDLEPTETRYSLQLGTRYYLREFHAIKTGLYYGRVRGSDENTQYPNRRFRNINFKSPIIELSAQYEFHVLRPKVLHLSGANSTNIFNGNRFGLYGSVGVGAFYFNPKGYYQGQWFDLHPLHTEGQGLPGGPRQYKRINITVPVGGGVSYLLNRNYKIGFEFGYRWTTTDYIDDVSGYFYDNDAIRDSYGKLAAYFANPSVALGDVPDREWYNENQPRGGNSSNDTYMFLQVVLSHSFTPSITNKPFKQKKGKRARNYNNSKKKFAKGQKGGKAKSYTKSSKIKNKKRKFKSPNLRFGKKRNKNKIKTF